MTPKETLEYLFGKRHVTEFRRPRFNLPQLVEQYKGEVMDQVLDPTHPEHWQNSPNKGWTPDPEASARYAMSLPSQAMMFAKLRPVQTDKPVVLTKIFRDLFKTDPPCGPQGIGDCVSFGNAQGLNVYQAVQIATGKANYKYQEAATESIYALARCEIGGQWNSYQDGAVGAWASRALVEKGCLSRTKIGPYDPKRAKAWGAKGLPDDLEPDAHQHLYQAAACITDYDQAVQLIQAGVPIPVCSNQGFSDSRDQDGFCQARGTWYHCMCFVGVRFDREGLLCAQSWGPNAPQGPLVLDQPTNTFWVEKKTSAYMLGQRDSFGHAGLFTGFEPNDAILDWSF